MQKISDINIIIPLIKILYWNTAPSRPSRINVIFIIYL